MEHRENLDQIAGHDVDEPVPVAHDLSNVIDPYLRDHSPKVRVVRQHLRRLVQSRDDGPCVVPRGPFKVLADGVEVIEGSV